MSTEYKASIIIGVTKNDATEKTLQAVDNGLLDSFVTDDGLIFGIPYESTEDYLCLNMDIFKHMIDKLIDFVFITTGQDAKVYLTLTSY